MNYLWNFKRQKKLDQIENPSTLKPGLLMCSYSSYVSQVSDSRENERCHQFGTQLKVN
jgi:hypothetical protein